MTPDPKRTAQACRVYDALLRYYPIAFQREYGDTLALQFRDEYREVLASGDSLFRFWIFILFDFMRSLLSEVLEEGVKMIKKNFILFSSIGAGVATLIFSISVLFDFNNLGRDGWRVNFIVTPFFLIFGSLTLLGTTIFMMNHPFFWVVSGLSLITALLTSFILFPGAIDHYSGFIDNFFLLLDNLFESADRAFTNIMFSHFIFVGIFGIGLMAKRKWKMGLSLFIISLPTFINLVFFFADPRWLNGSFLILMAGAWFTIAWLSRQESETGGYPDALEAAG